MTAVLLLFFSNPKRKESEATTKEKSSKSIPFIAVQALLSKKDMPVGKTTAIFFNGLAGATSISIAQNIFTKALIREMPRYTSVVDPAVIFGAGSTRIREVTPARSWRGS
ncbi:hypothetical protein LTR70_007359 [Exophiala xenobiotica]|uniref:Uncharacterized protein n=1 Tax=Lithohypha guttulata TaxID=1690604 RepID=A0ABR0K4L0_9EURO|nr:hypothetical protein LTR24_006912 [Lithohypha guttulata]KAK5313991.1 hypothetical protein LTR70_007359 [Exophiala xenobiotica]